MTSAHPTGGETGAGTPGATDAVEPDGPEGSPPPTGYRLITPAEWYRIPLESEERRERSVRALVDRTHPNRDEAAGPRRELRDLLDHLTTRAAAGGGLELHLSTQTLLGVPLPVSLLVTVESPDPGESLEISAELLARGLRRRHPEAEVTVVALPAGESVRVRREELPKDAEELGYPADRTTVVLTHYLPVPGTGAHLLLTFSTPLIELADPLLEMCDAIAASLLWRRDGDGEAMGKRGADE
ncbi:hypothetical protein FNQ90_03080 [Streptomyces alkaliphilus]|uniref:Uncharacterized protein n=1 Tax=Streptomyces alkaliphilus TaxID=1472722 RepID=A0A7W3TA98_9ACTN|nr:hypothetical protein [Streptomyces alkaliphilus]MBB0243119.1 hypothetical protein [Streptomyces alkaliphilus]